MRQRQKAKFVKTRYFEGDRICMCIMKRLGRRQQFWKAIASICANIQKMYDRRVEEIGEEKRRKKMRQRQTAEFLKTRRFVGDMIRMHRMKRLGRRKQFWKASASICANIQKMYNKKSEEIEEELIEKVLKNRRETDEGWKRIVSKSATSGGIQGEILQVGSGESARMWREYKRDTTIVV